MALRARMGLATPVVRFMWQPRRGWLLSGKPPSGEGGGRRRSLIRAFERGTGVVTIAAGENQVGGREHRVSGQARG